MKRIPLTRGLYTVVDDEDLPMLSQWKWLALNGRTQSYAARWSNEGGKHLVRMHREITACPAGLQVDHIDRNGLNNRRANLRVCTPHQNACNKKKPPNTSSGYKGVYRINSKDRNNGRWRATIHANGGVFSLGVFDDEREAARAYDRRATEEFGEFANLNFPQAA